jgi:hypothetical protein
MASETKHREQFEVLFLTVVLGRRAVPFHPWSIASDELPSHEDAGRCPPPHWGGR